MKSLHLILASLAAGLLLLSCSPQTSDSSATAGLTPAMHTTDTPQGRTKHKGNKKKVRTATASYTYHTCGVYSSTDLFFRDITSVGIDAHSSTIISQLPDPTTDFDTNDQADEKVNLGTSSTPTYVVQPNGGHIPPMYPQSNPPPAPWANGWFIEPIADAHAVSLITGSCSDFETYKTKWTASAVPPLGSLAAYDGQENDLTSSWASQMVPDHDAMTQSGVPFLGTVDYGEDASLTAIPHILAMMMKSGIGVSNWGYVYPATNPSFVPDTGCTVGTTTGLACTHPLHEGDVLRLQSSFNCTSQGGITISTKGQLVCNQLKTSGIILTDQAMSYQLRFGLSTSGSTGWTYSTDLQPLLSALRITDFDVMNETAAGGIKCASGKASPPPNVPPSNTYCY